MSKLKSPLHSLGATGSLGDSLSFTRRRGLDIIEKRPIPSDRKTLSQMYHRWLYEDYAYLWRQQTPAVQATYRSLGAKCHLTGYQYWMSYQLTNLPDIVAWWRMDSGDISTATDYSRNGFNGTIFGASPFTGVIDGSLWFDGLNDNITVTSPSFPTLTFPYTLECFIYQDRTQPDVQCYFFQKNKNFRWGLNKNGDADLWYYDGVAWRTTGLLSNLADKTIFHIALTAQAAGANTQFRYYENGVLISSPLILGHPQSGPATLRLGSTSTTGQRLKGFMDNAILHNRVLDNTEILRHSQRRYPLS